MEEEVTPVCFNDIIHLGEENYSKMGVNSMARARVQVWTNTRHKGYLLSLFHRKQTPVHCLSIFCEKAKEKVPIQGLTSMTQFSQRLHESDK